jgi:hypothetical protein
VNTTVFITRFFKSRVKSRALDARVRAFFALFLCFGLLFSPSIRAAELTQPSVERAEDGVYASAQVQFELPAAVEDALLKGIPMFFVAQADVYQSRWYWADKRVASATRTIRLAFQPLTRRWRVNIVSGLISNSAGLRATLNQNYDTLPEAMSAVQRLPRWRIADNAEIESDTPHRMELSFNLDLSQLPRPFQIGVVGQKDWVIAAQRSDRLQLAPYKPGDRPKSLLPPAKEADK